MSPYAKHTKVSADRSSEEVRRLLRNAGATDLMVGDIGNAVQLLFKLKGRTIRFTCPLPTWAEMSKDPAGRRRPEKHVPAAMEQEIQRRWRAVVLVVKAKLEAVATGIVTFDQEWLAHVVTRQDGKTVGELAIPELDTGGAESIRGLLGPGSGSAE